MFLHQCPADSELASKFHIFLQQNQDNIHSTTGVRFFLQGYLKGHSRDDANVDTPMMMGITSDENPALLLQTLALVMCEFDKIKTSLNQNVPFPGSRFWMFGEMSQSIETLLLTARNITLPIIQVSTLNFQS